MKLAGAQVIGSLVLAASLAACFGGESSSPLGDRGGLDAGSLGDDAGPATVQVLIVDGTTGAPVPNAVVAIERGGLYLPIADYSKANPAYVFGAIAGADGRFTITLPGGVAGFHAFANDYLYVGKKFDSQKDTGVFTIAIEPRPAQIAKPTMTNASLSPSPATAGATITLHADLATGAATDAISDEVVLVDPKTNRAIALAPPRAGPDRDHYPDGTYTATFVAPVTPGTYTYALAATTGQCSNADTVTLQLVVQ